MYPDKHPQVTPWCPLWEQCVNCIHAIATETPTIAALKNLHVDPLTTGLRPGEGNHFQVADASRDLLWHSLTECLHHGIGELLAWTEAGDGWRWQLRVRQATFGRDDIEKTVDTGHSTVGPVW